MTEEEEEEVSVDEMARAQRPEDTPKPDSTSGMRFDELYRLRGVVSYLLTYVSSFARQNDDCFVFTCIPNIPSLTPYIFSSVQVLSQLFEKVIIGILKR